MGNQGARDQAVAVLAGRQGGVASHRQLIALGLTPKAIHVRVRAGRLHPIHRGVYAVGHRAVGIAGMRWAAVLAVGDGAVISHGTAGAAYDLRPSRSSLIHVTLPGRSGRKRRAGIRVHRPELLLPDEVTTLDGLPITTPARTLLDLAAGGLRSRALEAAVDAAERRRLLDFADLHELLARYPRRRGTASLKAVLAAYEPGDSRSRLEEIVAELCADSGLPRPAENCVIEGKVRDFYWPHARLVVEADSYSFHRSPTALNDDRERDVELTLSGYRTLRFTWEQVTRRPKYVARSILAALRAT